MRHEGEGVGVDLLHGRPGEEYLALQLAHDLRIAAQVDAPAGQIRQGLHDDIVNGTDRTPGRGFPEGPFGSPAPDPVAILARGCPSATMFFATSFWPS